MKSLSVRRLLLFTIIFFFVQISALAQTSIPTVVPWPPEDIFANQVIVIKSEIPKPDFKCEEALKDNFFENEWQWILDKQSGDYRFCNRKTGQVSDGLPRTIPYATDSPITSSPDEKWLLFWAIEENSQGGIYDKYVLYSFQIATKKIIHLGSIPYTTFKNDIHVAEWVDNRQGAVYQGGAPESNSNQLYSFIVDKENSLKVAITGWINFDKFLSRYEYLQTNQFVKWKTGSANVDDVDCTLSLYDRHSTRTYILGDNCLPLYDTFEDQNQYILHGSNRYYYRLSNTTKMQLSKIVALDVTTGLSQAIIYGDVQLLSVSSDGNYLVLILDHSNLALYDVTRKNTIYLPDQFRKNTYPSETYVFNWIKDNEVLIFYSGKYVPIIWKRTDDPAKLQLSASIRLIEITPDDKLLTKTISGDELPEPQSISSNSRWVLAGNKIYDLNTGSHFSILTDNSEMYYTELSWIDDNHIKATVHSKENYNKQIIYTLAFNLDS